MKSPWQLTPIAYYHGAMKEKFGIPRQPGLVEGLFGQIIFEAEFKNEAALRGLDDFSHIWLIWGFSESQSSEFRPTVRPPRLHGNERMGVFATRSPFRPNSLGLSAVKLVGIEDGKILVAGADLMDGTPIFDIKPYLPYTDQIPEATGGFASERPSQERLAVLWPEELRGVLEDEVVVTHLLAQDPRPAYQDDSERVYGMRYGDWNIRFRVKDKTLTVVELRHD